MLIYYLQFECSHYYWFITVSMSVIKGTVEVPTNCICQLIHSSTRSLVLVWIYISNREKKLEVTIQGGGGDVYLQKPMRIWCHLLPAHHSDKIHKATAKNPLETSLCHCGLVYEGPHLHGPHFLKDVASGTYLCCQFATLLFNSTSGQHWIHGNYHILYLV